MLTLEKTAVKAATMPFNQPSDAVQMGCSPNTGFTPLPQPVCAWCAKEAGEGLEAIGERVVTHGVCARHWCMTLLQCGNIPVQAIKDRAVRMFGAREGLAAFETAVRLVANGLTTESLSH